MSKYPGAMVDANPAQHVAHNALREPAGLWPGSGQPSRDVDWAFDDLLGLAAEICNVPLVLLTLLGPRSECNPVVAGWWGEHQDQQTRIVALADAVNRHGDAVVIADLRLDPRHADAPAVAGAPGVRFCASLALVSPGGRQLGALSVLDLAPGSLAAPQMERLQRLAAQLSMLLVAPRLQHEVERLTASTRVLADDQHARLTLRCLGD
ncbi:MAG: GAF domain-containing protein, partial [Pseudomonadota bacterium]|nr:GAF domain-containing protein [Pseudomonadota bacterium]